MVAVGGLVSMVRIISRVSSVIVIDFGKLTNFIDSVGVGVVSDSNQNEVG